MCCINSETVAHLGFWLIPQRHRRPVIVRNNYLSQPEVQLPGAKRVLSLFDVFVLLFTCLDVSSLQF